MKINSPEKMANTCMWNQTKTKKNKRKKRERNKKFVHMTTTAPAHNSHKTFLYRKFMGAHYHTTTTTIYNIHSQFIYDDDEAYSICLGLHQMFIYNYLANYD